MVKRLQAAYQVSERRACRVIGSSRSTHRYRSCRDERAELRIRLRDLATSRVRYGYRRLHILLKREGWQVNHKLVYRLYVEEDLQMRIPPKNATRAVARALSVPRLAKPMRVGVWTSCQIGSTMTGDIAC